LIAIDHSSDEASLDQSEFFTTEALRHREEKDKFMFSMSSDNPIADEVSTRVAPIITNLSPPCLCASVVSAFLSDQG
jgi:hypothetical protein